MTQNLKAFLDMLAVSEGTAGKGDNGYNVLYGGGLFSGYADHPRKFLSFPINGKMVTSSAAGRYQILAKFYDHYKVQLGLPDFSPASQDAIAIQLIRECKALDDINAGNISAAITKCKSRWASLPGAGYGQHEQKEAHLVQAYTSAGGTVA
jgi:muramidase (phage lysozyme)